MHDAADSHSSANHVHELCDTIITLAVIYLVIHSAQGDPDRSQRGGRQALAQSRGSVHRTAASQPQLPAISACCRAVHDCWLTACVCSVFKCVSSGK